jgi:hypothetical protein
MQSLTTRMRVLLGLAGLAALVLVLVTTLVVTDSARDATAPDVGKTSASQVLRLRSSEAARAYVEKTMWAQLRSAAPGETVTGYCPLGIAGAYGFDVRTRSGTRHELLFHRGASVYVLRRAGGTRGELVAAAKS